MSRAQKHGQLGYLTLWSIEQKARNSHKQDGRTNKGNMEEVPECHVKELGLASPASRSQIPPEGPVWRVSVDRHRSSHPEVPPLPTPMPRSASHTHCSAQQSVKKKFCCQRHMRPLLRGHCLRGNKDFREQEEEALGGFVSSVDAPETPSFQARKWLFHFPVRFCDE